jgi:DNA-binding GntR family transcriptional regulator
MPDGDRPTRGGAVGHIQTALAEDIAIGALQPGERLDETRLSARFSVSRTPVREALSRLTAQGILVQGPGRGVRVADYTRAELAEMLEAMHEIEVACARIAAQRLTLLDRAAIEAAQAECLERAEAGDRPGYLRANEAFHAAIYRATGNRWIQEMAADFRRRTGPFRAKRLVSGEDLMASARSHGALIASIFSADSRTAVDGMRAHMTTSFLETLAANTAQPEGPGPERPSPG